VRVRSKPAPRRLRLSPQQRAFLDGFAETCPPNALACIETVYSVAGGRGGMWVASIYGFGQWFFPIGDKTPEHAYDRGREAGETLTMHETSSRPRRTKPAWGIRL
jgi:hypothetical protein